ncbi:MAG: hypothetical protein K2W96_22200, partial [Gemmataceae bacterium]|nr:hypothetical protein [Gemmataceae bacterium]
HYQRGLARQKLEQHEAALADLAQAVQLDAEYTVAYCLQRARLLGMRGDWSLALVEYSAVLRLDPHHPEALQGHEEALRRHQADPSPPSRRLIAYLRAGAAALEGPSGARLVRSASGTGVHRAAPTQEQPALPEPDPAAGDFELVVDPTSADWQGGGDAGKTAIGFLPDETVAEEDEDEEAEAQLRLKQEAEERRAAMKAEVERKMAEAKKEKEKKEKAAKKGQPLTPEESAALWKARRNHAILAVGALVAASYAWSFVSPMLHRYFNPIRPPSEMAVDDLVAEFKQDSAAAEKKYANLRVILAGKVVVQQKGKDQLPSVHLESGGQRIECENVSNDDVGRFAEGEAKKVSGIPSKAAGGGIKLRFAGAS